MRMGRTSSIVLGPRGKGVVLGGGTGGASGPRIAISSTSVSESAPNPTTIGTLSVVNGSGVYTFTKTADPDAKFAVSGSNLNTAAALDYETATFHSVTIQADNGVDTPLSRTFTINVTNVLEVTLAALALSASTFADDDAAGTVIGAIQNKTTGSTLSISPADGRVSIDGSNNLIVGLTPATAGTFDITIRETHPDGSNSPRDTAFTITVSTAGAFDNAFTFGGDFYTFGGDAYTYGAP